jgi:hypothetical protein
MDRLVDITFKRMFRVDWQTFDEILHLIEPTMVARDAAKAINSLVAKGFFTILEEYLMDVSLLKMDLPFAPDSLLTTR